VGAFRDLLWARAAELRIPTTQVCISSAVFTPDGGVDAAISDRPGPAAGDDLLGSGTRYQIKTGPFDPWHPAKVKKELFGNKAQKYENLGSEVQRAIREGRRFVLACFG